MLPTRSRQPSAMATPSTPELDTEMGVSLRGMPFSEAFVGPDRELIRFSEPTVRQLVAMRRNDGQARALYRLLTSPVRVAASRAAWLPADGGDAEAEHAKALLTTPSVSGGMRTPLPRVIGQMLLSVTDGFAPFELVYTVPTRGPLKGKYALDKIAYRPSDTVSFKVDDHGDYDGFQQRSQSPNGQLIDVHIPKDRSIYAACSEEESPFYGVSYFNAAFYHYDKKTKLYYLAHLAAQHRAVGSRLGRYPESATRQERTAFRAALADFGLGQAMTVPAGEKWAVEDLGKSPGDFPFMDFVNHHNSQMSKSVLAPFLDDAQGGEKSLVDFGGQTDSLYLMLVRTLISEMESLFNDWLIPRFIDWNFGSEKYPKMKFGSFSDEQLRAIHNTFDKLSTAGQSAAVTRPFLLELEKTMAEEMGFDLDYKRFTEALEKQTDLTLQHFEEDLAAPPKQAPFQPAVGTAPADKEPGVPAKQQWLPNNEAAAEQPPGSPPGAAARQPPALPSQLSAPGISALRTWMEPDEESAVTAADRELIGLAMTR